MPGAVKTSESHSTLVIHVKSCKGETEHEVADGGDIAKVEAGLRELHERNVHNRQECTKWVTTVKRHSVTG